jgi:hypothetical protein
VLCQLSYIGLNALRLWRSGQSGRSEQGRELARSTLSVYSAHSAHSAEVERETGIEPATNSLEGCDSTTELLPPLSCSRTPHLRRREARLAASPLAQSRCALPSPTPLSSHRRRWRKSGGEGRVRTSVGTRPADLQSAAIDRSATSPNFSRVPQRRQPRRGCFIAPRPAATDL